MDETRVGIRELKSRLSEYLRRVKAGETITVTDRGTLIGRIIPIPATPPTIEERLHVLAGAGLLAWNGGKLPPYDPPAVNCGERSLSDLIVEERE